MRYLIAAALVASATVSAAYAAETITYKYDAQGRLTTVQHSGSVNNGLVTSYAHDNADNRTSVTVTGAAR